MQLRAQCHNGQDALVAVRLKIDRRQIEQTEQLLPNPNTAAGRAQLKFSMLTCAQQIDTKTFCIRGGRIHEVEACPFVTVPYGLGNGWTEGPRR